MTISTMNQCKISHSDSDDNDDDDTPWIDDDMICISRIAMIASWLVPHSFVGMCLLEDTIRSVDGCFCRIN